jgi:hypothetical protein
LTTDINGAWPSPLHRQLAQMLKLQDEMNAMVNPQWRTADYAWHRAIMAEGVELMDHGHWKWWKESETNVAQAQLELVDIWHFAMSWYMVRFDKGPDEPELVDAIVRRLNHTLAGLPPATHARLFTAEAINREIERLVAAAAEGLFNHDAFIKLMNFYGLDFDLLFQMYFAKNGLNRFRQMYGYKLGTYLKHDWAGLEDNVALEQLLPEIVSEADPMNALLERLTARYVEVCAAKAWYAIPSEGKKFKVVEGAEHASTAGAVRLPYRAS